VSYLFSNVVESERILTIDWRDSYQNYPVIYRVNTGENAIQKYIKIRAMFNVDGNEHMLTVKCKNTDQNGLITYTIDIDDGNSKNVKEKYCQLSAESYEETGYTAEYNTIINGRFLSVRINGYYLGGVFVTLTIGEAAATTKLNKVWLCIYIMWAISIATVVPPLYKRDPLLPFIGLVHIFGFVSAIKVLKDHLSYMSTNRTVAIFSLMVGLPMLIKFILVMTNAIDLY